MPTTLNRRNNLNANNQKLLDRMPTRSAWARGVKDYAADLLQQLEENGLAPTKENMLNGAASWSEWAYGGCGLVYDADIAERTCSPSELKKTRNGARRPNAKEEWLDVEARAVGQAAAYILRAAKR
jgi:hypothetical protein